MKQPVSLSTGARVVLGCVFLTVLVLSALTVFFSSPSTPERSYWVWNAYDLSYVDAEAELILYQGDVDTEWRFHRRGVQPHPLDHDGPVTVLFRLYRLGPVDDVVAQYRQFKQDWEGRGITVAGLQIDFDSPSSGLGDYREWLQTLQASLPEDPVSATTLATYVFDAPEPFRLLAREVDYLAMQLYRGYAPHEDYQAVINFMRAEQLTHRVGVTLSPDFPPDTELCGSHCQGVSVFLNQLEPES